MKILQIELPDDLAAQVDAKAVAANVSRDEFVKEALTRYQMPSEQARPQLDAFFASAEGDVERCQREVAENSRRMLTEVEWNEPR